MVETLIFYMTEASIELMEGRREYLERVIIPRIIKGIDDHSRCSESLRNKPQIIEFISVLKAALEFFNEKGFVSKPIQPTDTMQ